MKQLKTPCDLNSCMFCKGCVKEWLPVIAINRKTLQVKKGEVIFEEGEDVNCMYFVNSGTVKVHKQWGEKELIIRFAGETDIFGHRGLGEDLVYPVSATAIEPCTICSVDIEFFNASLKVNPDFLYKLLVFFADELKISERRMRNLAHMPVKGRIANALLQLQNKFGTSPAGNINLLLRRQDLAAYAGTTYETVFRVLNELMELNLLKVEDKAITIHNQEELIKVINEGSNGGVKGGS